MTTLENRLKGMTALAVRAKNAPRLIRFELRRRLLARRHLRGEGLEIGALHSPLHVPARARVRYVDRMDLAGLRSHYPELAKHRLVAVDVIDDGERLGSQPDSSVDFIIANHFIEHTEDPIGTLANHLRVLRPGGILYLAVPDRHRTFDADRPATTLEHVVNDHLHGAQCSRLTHLEEWARLVEKVPDATVAERVAALDEQRYSIHYHVWSAPEFRSLLHHARDEQGLPFSLEVLEPNEHEFIAILRRT
jgi:SAM-dependent methyltransferase